MKPFAATLVGLALLLAPGAATAKTDDPIGDLIGKTVREAAGAILKLKATLYHVGAVGVGTRDSLGCTVSPMRTLAVDPRIIPRRSIVFIEETVGLTLPNGERHDGLWYASDTGGAIKGNRIDLFTGNNRGSMRQFMKLNTRHLTARRVGTFRGCPPR